MNEDPSSGQFGGGRSWDAGTVIRLLGLWLGVAILAGGAIGAFAVFHQVYVHLRQPEVMEATLEHWGTFWTRSEVYVYVGPEKYPVSRLVVLGVLGAGSAFLGIFALMLMASGARIIAVLTSERKAIQTLLQKTLAVPPR